MRVLVSRGSSEVLKEKLGACAVDSVALEVYVRHLPERWLHLLVATEDWCIWNDCAVTCASLVHLAQRVLRTGPKIGLLLRTRFCCTIRGCSPVVLRIVSVMLVLARNGGRTRKLLRAVLLISRRLELLLGGRFVSRRLHL